LAENIVQRKEPKLQAWYNGPTLGSSTVVLLCPLLFLFLYLISVERIDQFETTSRDFQKPLRLIVSDVYKPQSGGAVAIGGKVESGFVTSGDQVSLLLLSSFHTSYFLLHTSFSNSWH
jgi:translation elongation factor EF-1alpha